MAAPLAEFRADSVPLIVDGVPCRPSGAPLVTDGNGVDSSFLPQPLNAINAADAANTAKPSRRFIALVSFQDSVVTEQRAIVIGVYNELGGSAKPGSYGGFRMTDSHDPSPIHTRTSPRIVIACLAAMAVFIGAVALLYWTWLPRQNPNTMIIVQGDAGYVGAEVTVDPAAPNTTPLTAILAAEDNYRVRIHVPPGVYRVTIRHGGRVIASSDAEPAAREPAYMRLTPSDKSPTTRRSR